ncbi:MAG TPA: ABC transporter permease [Thermoanaerobaculia bacterium]|nr:ABC transporter permease [Thermoanaerobaculia bacterium]
MHALKQDLLYAWRQLVAHPGYALVAILTLALGIGANTAIFSVIYGVLFRPLPYQDADRLVHVRQVNPAEPDADLAFAVQEYLTFQRESRTFEHLNEYHSMFYNLTGLGEPDRVQVGVVNETYFPAMGVQPIDGRAFSPADNETGAEPVTLLSHRYWQSRFGGDRGVIGRALQMNDRSITVIGILPPLPAFPDANDIYIPPAACPFRSNEMMIQERSMRMVALYGKLAPGRTVADAQTELDAINRRMRQEHAASYPADSRTELRLGTVREELLGRFRPLVFMLVSTVGLVLLIACANVANLTLARMIRRDREVAMRTALGASPGRLVRQLVTESALLSVIGGLLGLTLAFLGKSVLVSFASRFTPWTDEISLSWPVLVFTLLISVGTGLVFGLFPAWHSLRRDLVTTLKDASGGKSTGAANKHRSRRGLVIVQLAASFVLLFVTALMVRSLINLRQVETGFEQDNVLTMLLPLSFGKYQTYQQIRDFHLQLVPRVQSLPGVVSAAVASDFPLNGVVATPIFRVQNREVKPTDAAATATIRMITDDYFKTLSIPLLKGRDFDPTDTSEAPMVIVINRTLAERYFPNEEPLGQRLGVVVSPTREPRWRTIVGVVGDVSQARLGETVEPEFYIPITQYNDFEMRLLVKTQGPPRNLLPEIRRVIRSADPELPVVQVRTLQEVREESMAPTRLTTRLMMLFALLAFVIAVTGISGVIAFLTQERTPEIGIRMALGAEKETVVGLMLREAALLVAAGLSLGLVAALVVARQLQDLLYGLQAADVPTLLGVAVILAVVVGVACWVPARRAASVDPVIALRAG